MVPRYRLAITKRLDDDVLSPLLAVADVAHVPCVKTVAVVDDAHHLRSVIHGKSLILTSGAALDVLLALIPDATSRCAVVGESTARRCIDAGLHVEVVAPNAQELSARIAAMPPTSWLHLHGSLSPPLSIPAERLRVYSTKLLHPIVGESFDGTLAFSPSALHSLLTNNSPESLGIIWPFGPTTAFAARECGLKHVFTGVHDNVTHFIAVVASRLGTATKHSAS